MSAVTPTTCKGEDEPDEEEETNGIVDLVFNVCVTLEDTSARNQDQGVADPETTVRRQGSSTKGIATDKLPHSSEKLNQSTGSNRHSNDDIRLGDMTSLDVDQGEHESCGCEREETERGWIGDHSQMWVTAAIVTDRITNRPWPSMRRYRSSSMVLFLNVSH